MAALKRKLTGFNTFVMKKEDLDWRNDVFTDQLMTRIKEIGAAKGVLDGVLNELEVYADGTDIKIKTGVAYIAGERVHVEALETIAAGADGTHYVLIQHDDDDDTDPNATRIDDLSNPHVVWYRDGYTLIYTTNGAQSEDPTHLLLATVVVTGGTPVVTDGRVWLTLSLPLPDLSVLTAWLANLAVTNPKIGNKAVNSGKIADSGVAEINLAEETDLVPLAFDRQEEPVAGDKVTPGSYVTYYADTGGVYEYKIAGRCLFESHLGPIRHLRCKGILGSPGTGEVGVFLVAWTDTPASYDPEDPSYDGEVDSLVITNPTPDYPFDLELDVHSLADPADGYIYYALVLRNSSTSHMGVYNVLLCGQR